LGGEQPVYRFRTNFARPASEQRVANFSGLANINKRCTKEEDKEEEEEEEDKEEESGDDENIGFQTFSFPRVKLVLF
jgi:ribosomal protein L12E/L44/L45/RPP1/RPP2